MDMYGSSLESFGHLPFDINYAAETTGDYYAMFADQAQIEEDATTQVNAEMPWPEGNCFDYSGLPTALPSSLSAGVETWAGAAAQAPQCLPQAALESCANFGFVQQLVVPQQFFVPQQVVGPHHPEFSQHPFVPQPVVLQDTMAPQQPIAFQQHFVPEQFAPQTVTSTALAAPSAAAATTVPATPVVPAALAAPQAAVASFKRLSSTISAIHVFEANVLFHKESRPNGLRTWKEVAHALANLDPAGLAMESVFHFAPTWEEPMIYMSKQDFRAYHYKQRKIIRAHDETPPPLLEWIPKFAFCEKELAMQRKIITERAVAQILLKKSLRGSGSGSKVGPKDKGKGKARATPYTRPSSSLRPSPLGSS
ncbi:hypothetical protein FRC10_010854 [Ceratobasidium sp. 414]|nr:hypothetical protein FRC10_010854 [Ceratobasidium sp. 414]